MACYCAGTQIRWLDICFLYDLLVIAVHANLFIRFNSIDDGFRYGELALKMCDIFKEDVWLCRTWACFYGAIYCKKYPASEALEPLRNAHRAGLRTGDIEFAVVSNYPFQWYRDYTLKSF